MKRRLLIGAAEHDQLMKTFDSPLSIHKFCGEPVEQVRVGRRIALEPEVVWRPDDGFAEMVLPEAIHHHASGKRVAAVSDPSGKLETPM